MGGASANAKSQPAQAMALVSPTIARLEQAVAMVIATATLAAKAFKELTPASIEVEGYAHFVGCPW